MPPVAKGCTTSRSPNRDRAGRRTIGSDTIGASWMDGNVAGLRMSRTAVHRECHGLDDRRRETYAPEFETDREFVAIRARRRLRFLRHV
jgi:hypothetical protein